MTEKTMEEVYKDFLSGKMKVYKYYGNENYMKQYNSETFYECAACKCNVSVTHRARHVRTPKHLKNTQKAEANVGIVLKKRSMSIKEAQTIAT